MTEDDWAPLPDAALATRPGEAADVVRREVPLPVPVAPAPPVSAVSAAAPKPRSALSPEQERLLAQLRAKVAGSPAAANLLTAARKRQEKAERKRRAVADPTLAATVVTGSDPFAIPVVEYAAGADGRDEREESEWFAKLPAKEQDRLRREWTAERCRFADSGQQCRRRLRRVTWQGALVMGALAVAQSLLLGGFGLVPVMTLAGAIAALLAELARGDRFVYAVAGGLAWVVVMGPVILTQPLAMPGLLMAAYGMAAVGMEGEMRKSGGFKEG